MRWRRSASGIIVAAVSLLLVGGCATVSGSGGGAAESPPQAVSVQEYETVLAGAVAPLDSALRRLADASAYKGLEERVATVETATDGAVVELGKVTPPAELSSEHPELVSALQTFQDELGELSAQVNDRGLCTGSAVWTSLGNADGTTALRDALAAVSAKLPDDPPALNLPSARDKGGSRPPNGKFLRAGQRDGQGELTVDNGGSGDAVVTLSKGSKPAFSVYVRKAKRYTVKGVPDGSYTVFFTGGADWDGRARAFGRNCAFQRFEEPLKFRTTRAAGQVFYQAYRITLQPVAGGTAQTDDVDPNDFPNS